MDKKQDPEIEPSSYEWAIGSIIAHSDSDIFPKVTELQLIQQKMGLFIEEIRKKDAIAKRIFGAHRRFLIPRSELSYRSAIQLHPQDSIILTAILFQYGMGIERRRLGTDNVFSYRFAPNDKFELYSNSESWNLFWKTANYKAGKSSCKSILYCDIADFYNQINHHTIENQLVESGLPNKFMSWIIDLFKQTTGGISRGIPVGPYPTHLIAEASLIPFDEALKAKGYDFIRFVDDILVFCPEDVKPRSALLDIVNLLDKHQKLILQKHKSKVFTPHEFIQHSANMLEDRPINPDESDILAIAKKYSGNNPYRVITFSDISPKDWDKIKEDTIAKIIEEYVNKGEVDYIRLSWFYRRLSQIGHPGAITVSLKYMRLLEPCLSAICNYFISLKSIRAEQWKDLGSELIELQKQELVKHNEFMQLSLLNIFTQNKSINHFSELLKLYKNPKGNVLRELILAAVMNGFFSWVKEFKDEIYSMDDWQRLAFLYALSSFPKDERKHYLRSISKIIRLPMDAVMLD